MRSVEDRKAQAARQGFPYFAAQNSLELCFAYEQPTSVSFVFRKVGRSPDNFTRRKHMEQKRLGKQGLTVSAMGLGCMGMSDAYGPADEAESIATIHRALDLG